MISFSFNSNLVPSIIFTKSLSRPCALRTFNKMAVKSRGLAVEVFLVLRAVKNSDDVWHPR